MGKRDRASLWQPISQCVSRFAPSILSLGVLLVLGIAACGDDPADPVELEVNPTRLELIKGRTGSAAAMNHGVSAGTAVSWRSANAAIATVTEAADGSAMITGTGVGETQIFATLRDGTASLTVVVGEAVVESISLTPPAPSLAAGTSVSLVATAMLSDKTTRDVTTQVTWSSSDTSKVTVNAAGGVRGLVKGSATVRASLSGLQAMTTITVTDAVLTALQVGPTTPLLALGLTQQMTATGIFSDGTNQNVTTMATWTSSATTVATVSPAGLVTTVGVGDTTITAAFGGRTASTTVTVTAAALRSIAITATPSLSVAAGLTLSLTATGTFTDNSTMDLSDMATWSSSNTAIATMAGRVATGVAVGNATISAVMNGVTGTATLQVTPALLVSLAVTPADTTLPLGSTRQFTATGTFTDSSTQNLTTQVTWTSSDDTRVVISNADGSRGVATGLTTGTVTITATLGGVSGQTGLEVIGIVLQSIAITSMTSGDLAVGHTRQLIATGTYSDNSTADLTTQVTWTSSDDTRATVSNIDGSRGLVTAVGAGGVTITATLAAISGTLAINIVPPVLDAITITPATAVVLQGSTLQLAASGRYSDNSNSDITNMVTWASSDTAVATVSATGLVTGVGAGTTTITATLSGVTGSSTITGKILTALTIGTVGDLAWGTSKQLVATATYSDATMEDATQLVDWSSSDTNAITVTTTGTRGVATAASTAGATITATFGAISDTETIAGCKVLINELTTQSTAAATDEYIEVASTCTTTQSLTGLRLVYRSANGTADASGGLNLTQTLAAGAYLYYVNNNADFRYPDEAGLFTFSMSGTAGGAALRIGTGPVIVDSVAWGTVTNGFAEGTSIAAPSTTTSASRTPDRTDTNQNNLDFALTTARTPGAAN